MQEILPGLLHWTAHHDGIDSDVSSHYLVPAATLFDPMVPDEGLEAFDDRRPGRIVLSCRHHLRHVGRFVEAYGCSVHANEAGLHEFEGRGSPEVQGFAAGDEPAPGVRALRMGAIAPDDTALLLDVDSGALLLADALTHTGEELAFVPDSLMGDDPEGVKRGLTESMGRILDEETFEHLLFAHGDPIVGGGRKRLERFVAGNESPA